MCSRRRGGIGGRAKSVTPFRLSKESKEEARGKGRGGVSLCPK